MENCLFCKIVNGEIPAAKVYEDDAVLAFKDINPQAPVHVLFIPKQHVASVAQPQDATQLGELFLHAADYARIEGHEAKGYRLVTNHGDDAGQTVHHLHVHLLAGRQLGWPPG